MSYVRVNDSSDSEDDAAASSLGRSPSTHQASIPALPSSAHRYARVSAVDDDEHEESSENKDKDKGKDANRDKDATRAKSTDTDRGESDNEVEIHVRFGEGSDLCLRVPRTDTVAQFKEKIKEAKPSIGKKYLRLIHSGKILSDNKTLIESLPKSLFAQVEIPHKHQSRLSSSVEAVEAAASNILAGISSRTSSEKPAIRTHTSLGSILPTHISYAPPSHPLSDNPAPTSNTTPLSHTSTTGEQNHVTISIPSEQPSHSTNGSNNPTRSSTITIQTGPIFFLCSFSDVAPKPPPPSDTKKGKAVAIDSETTRSTSNSMRRNRSDRLSRSRPLGATPIPSQSTSAAAAAAATTASSRNPGSSSSNGQTREEQEQDESNDEADGELSPTITPRATGFDRLREAGFNEDEIRSIRRQFHASIGTTTIGENGIEVGPDQDEDSRERARRIEEEWIDQHGSETLPEGLEGSYGEMVWGLMLGFFMGLIVLFWFKEATFSRRQQMGIIAGLMINVGFGALHLYY